MSRPLLLDLYCGAGGAAVGYARAGFDVVGVDIVPQPNYPFEFIEGDAIEYLIHGGVADAIHASPPCQRHSVMSGCRPGLADTYPDLIDTTRDHLQTTGLPWVIENVEGARPFMRNPITLCGHMFGLKLYRHRLFELSEYSWATGSSDMAHPPHQPEHPRHIVPVAPAGHYKPGHIITVTGHTSPIHLAREAMGIDWMNRAELGEAIPPAYTEYVGARLLQQIEAAA